VHIEVGLVDLRIISRWRDALLWFDLLVANFFLFIFKLFLIIFQKFFKLGNALWVQNRPVRVNVRYLFDALDEQILIEKACTPSTISKDHNANALLDTCLASDPVRAAVRPSHHAISVALVIVVKAAVNVPRLPFEYAVPVFLVLEVFALVVVRLILAQPAVVGASHFLGLLTEPTGFALAPLSLAVLEPVFELALVDRSVGPPVLPGTFWLAEDVLPDVSIAVGKEVCAAPVAQIAIPFALVFVAVRP